MKLIRRVKVETDDGSFQFDSVGVWTQHKLRILTDYAERYSQVLAKQPGFKHAYIDAFSGPGEHIDRETGQRIPGSPLNALEVTPPFDHYYLVDENGAKAGYLRDKIGTREDVDVFSGDCNVVLIDKVFPRVRWEDFWRALCFVDPYGVHIDWNVIRKAGSMRSIELFINFSIYDMNLNMVRSNPTEVDEAQVARMDRFWGDHSWYSHLYERDLDLFGSSCKTRIGGAVSSLAPAYRERLKKVAGFKYVPEPVAMKNEQGGILYFLFFASHNATGNKIVSHIFKNYRRGAFHIGN